MKENAPNLGEQPSADAKRDAIHIAVIPLEAGEQLYPGCEVGVLSDGRASRNMPAIGIVDPFIGGFKSIEKGQRAWVLLYPKTITGLRHVWHHPDIPDEVTEPASIVNIEKEPMSESEKWLRNYAVRCNPYIENNEDAFRKMMNEAADGYVYMYGKDCHSAGDVDPQFFIHYSNYIGKVKTQDDFEYSCSC